jgi:hypothetical protein
LGLASSSTTGALSSTDWNTFNARVSGTGASGQVAFWNGTSSQTGDNGLFWDNVNKRLGIGTNAPTQTLDVSGSARFQSADQVLIRRTNVGEAFNVFTENIVNTLTISNLGVICRPNGTNPALTANIFSVASNVVGINGRRANTFLNINSSSNIAVASFGIYNGGTGEAQFLIPQNGNVLIGTTTDAGFRLDVNGTARVQGVLTTTADAVVNGVNVGRGGGAIATNTRVGDNALNANTTGEQNTAFGQNVLLSNTTGTFNTASGAGSLQINTTGNDNSAFGQNALRNNTTGNANTVSGINALSSNTTGAGNASFGASSGRNNTTGGNNVFLGSDAGRRISGGTSLTISNNSIFIGRDTRANADNETNQIVIGHTAIGLGSNTTVIGNSSTTFGRWFGNLLVGTSTNAGFALDVNGTARVQGVLTTTADAVVNGVNVGLGGGNISTNTRVGSNALLNNTTGVNNTANGVGALQNNTTGNSNTANGSNALQNNTTGSFNTAIGVQTLFSNTTGSSNTANGFRALFSTTTGTNNTANGREALQNNTIGGDNTAIGVNALKSNTTGSNNTANGVNAGRFIADGTTANTITNNSVFIGADTRANANNQTNQIVIGHTAIGLGSNTTVIGNSSTTFGRWFGNLLVGTSTNAGFALDVVGTARVQGDTTITGATSITRAAGQTALTASFGNTNSNIVLQSHSTSDFSRIRIGTAFSLSREGGGPSKITSTASSLEISSNVTEYLGGGAPAIRLIGGGNIVFSAWNTAASTITFGNGFNSYQHIQQTLARHLVWHQTDTSTVPSIINSALFSLSSTTRGFLPPRMTSAQRTAIASPAEGLLVIQTDGVQGLYIYINATWRAVAMV